MEQSLAALAWLRQQGCLQIVFKYCSTFDSTAEGNIGPVGEAIAAELGVRGVVACPAFPGAGRSVYMGNLFVGDVPLNESGVRHHPLTPMTDSDIRRWLRAQSSQPVGFVPWTTVSKGAAEWRAALAKCAADGDTLVIVDAPTDEDLLAIGEACAEAPFITGGSGNAIGLPRNFHRAGLVETAQRTFRPVQGREAILAGSCSQATLAQIAEHERAHPVLRLPVVEIVEGGVTAADVIDFVERNEGRAPLVSTSQPPGVVRALQARFGTEVVAHAIDSLFAEAATALVSRGLRRLVVARRRNPSRQERPARGRSADQRDDRTG